MSTTNATDHNNRSNSSQPVESHPVRPAVIDFFNLYLATLELLLSMMVDVFGKNTQPSNPVKASDITDLIDFLHHIVHYEGQGGPVQPDSKMKADVLALCGRAIGNMRSDVQHHLSHLKTDTSCSIYTATQSKISQSPSRRFQETAVRSGESDEDRMLRVYTLYYATVGGEFKHRSAWLFLKDKHKWKNLESTLAKRSRLMATDEEPEHFGDDELPRTPGLQRLAKSQCWGSNSTASSGSNPAAYQEFMAEQYKLDREAKMTVLEKESEDRRRLIKSQRIAEDMRVLQIDTRGMDPIDATIIDAQKARIRASYQPPN